MSYKVIAIANGVKITCGNCGYDFDITRKTYMAICPNCKKGISAETGNVQSLKVGPDPFVDSFRKRLNKLVELWKSNNL